MPKITNPKGIAMINRGFINSLLFKALDSLWILEEEGGQNREYVRCQTGAEVHATVACVARSSTSCAPLQLSKMKNSSAFRDNVTSPGKDCCPIVDSFEKNFSRKKDVLQVKHDRGNAKGIISEKG